jgi:hypothetical protein
MAYQTIEDIVLGSIEKNLVDISSKSYYLLILVVPVSSPVLFANASFFEKYDLCYINVNLLLSEHLVKLSHQYRGKEVMPILRNIINQEETTGIILNNLGILFDKSLSLWAFKIIKDLAKDRGIIAIWPGKVSGNSLIYAEPNHPEYCCEAIDSSFCVVDCSYEI